MLEYDFLKILNDYVKIYKEFLLPVVICDNSFEAHWSNPAAKSAYPQFTDTDGLKKLLAEFDLPKLLEKIKCDGTIGIEGALPFADLMLNLMPMTHAGEMVGAIVFFADSKMAARRGAVAGSKTPESFEKSVRKSVDAIFRVMDETALKADMMQSGWVKSSFQSIAKNSYFILRVATNLSRHSAFQAGNVLFSPQSTDVFALLREYADAVTGLAEDMGIPMRFSLPQEGGYAGIDAELFGLAFFNVLHNAMYFTKPDNEICVTGIADDAKLEIMVRDKGVGIPAKALHKIFDPYYSCGFDGTAGGVGLGLTLAKAAAELHGGRLTVESVENGGTTAVFTIPKGVFSRRITFAQGRDKSHVADRFSHVYVGLVDAAMSPYREPDDDEE